MGKEAKIQSQDSADGGVRDAQVTVYSQSESQIPKLDMLEVTPLECKGPT